jgi:hypothetical protein
MLESAIHHYDKETFMADPSFPSSPDYDLGGILQEIAAIGLLDDVALVLTSYVTKETEDNIVLQRLISMFLLFFNSSENRVRICEVTHNLLPLFPKADLTFLTRWLWFGIRSELPLECLIPIVLSMSSPKTTRWILHALAAPNSKKVGNLVINNYLDGTICWRVFGNFISHKKLFLVVDAARVLTATRGYSVSTF